MYQALRETADDIFAIFSVVRERNSALAIQRYTLLLGTGIFVPYLMGTITSAISSLDFSGFELVLTSQIRREWLVQNAIEAMRAYVVLNALLASVFLASSEANQRKFIVYFFLLAPLALVVLSFALGRFF